MILLQDKNDRHNSVKTIQTALMVCTVYKWKITITIFNTIPYNGEQVKLIM